MAQFRHSLEKDPDYLSDRQFPSRGHDYIKEYAPRNKTVAKIKTKGFFTAYEDSIIIAMTNQGHIPEEIAASLNRPVGVISNRITELRKRGEPLRKDRQLNMNGNGKR